MIRIFISLMLCILSTTALAFFNEQNDWRADRLGVGDTRGKLRAGDPWSMDTMDQYDYTTVYWVCNRGGSDSYDGTSPDQPLETFDYAMGKFNSLPSGGAILLCNGGKFTSNKLGTERRLYNWNGKRTNPISIRNYQIPDGPKEFPLVTNIKAGGVIMKFENSGAGSADVGYVIKNLKLSSLYNTSDTTGIWLINDVDYALVDNIYGFNIGITVASTHPATISAVQCDNTYDDLKFTHVVDGGDTIEFTGASTFCSSLATGKDDYYNLVVVGGSNDGKNLRVESSTATKITLSEGTPWDVIDSTNELGVQIVAYRSDGKNSFVEFRNIKAHDNSFGGFFGSLDEYSSLNNSEFWDNGSVSATHHHNIYFTSSSYGSIHDNLAYNNSQYQGGACASVNIVGHGNIDNFDIYNNRIIMDPSKSGGGCYGLAVGSAYTSAESFENIHIFNNDIINPGTYGIIVGSCLNCTIDYNTIFYSKSGAGATGIGIDQVPLSAGDIKTENLLIENNTIKTISGAWANTNSQAKGISIVCPDSLCTGTVDVKNNYIDGVYQGLYSDIAGGSTTVTFTGNTVVNATVTGP